MFPSKEMLQTIDDWIFWSGGSSALFWMDTLCIPVGESHQVLRTRCIDTMSSVYATSSPVFVLDKELMATSKSPSDDSFQRLYQIACSVWMCRSWTLQEAILPRDCVFKFQDELYQPTEDKDVQESGNDLEHYDIVQNTFDSFLRVREVKPIENPGEDAKETNRIRAYQDLKKLYATWNALAVRNTTEAADLWVILASCLDIKHSALRQLEPDQRMQHILFSLPQLPVSLLFNAGLKIDGTGNHCNRWIPKQDSRQQLIECSHMNLPGDEASSHSDADAHLEVDFSWRISAVLVEGPIVDSNACNLMLWGRPYRMFPILDADDQFRPENYVATCFIYEAGSDSVPRGDYRGAWLYVTGSHDVNDGDQPKTLFELVYFCPIVFEEIRESGPFAYYETLRLEHDEHKLWLKYGMLCPHETRHYI